MTPKTPVRRTPKSSIGHPKLQPSTSPNTFIRDHPRRAPGTPKDDEGLEGLPIPVPAMPIEVDFPIPQPTGSESFEEIITFPSLDSPIPAVEDDVGNMSVDSSIAFGIATPQTNTTSSPININSEETFGTPLTAKAAAAVAEAGLKPKRFLGLLPKQQRINFGLETPLRTKKSTTDIRSVLKTPLQARSTNLPDPSPSPVTRLLEAHSTKTPSKTRDPLGLLPRSSLGTVAYYASYNKENRASKHPAEAFKPNLPASQTNFPYKRDPVKLANRKQTTFSTHPDQIHSDHPDPTDPAPPRPSIDSVTSSNSAFEPGTFGQAHPLNLSVHRATPTFDFTASPRKLQSRFSTSTTQSEGERRSREGSAHGHGGFIGDGEGKEEGEGEGDEGLPTEQWELERFLLDAERIEGGHRGGVV